MPILWGEGHPWDDGEINLGMVSEKGAQRFLNTKGCFPVHSLFSLIDMEDKVIAHHGREQKGIPMDIQRVNEFMCADLIWKRVV